MAKTTTVSIRVDNTTKEQAEEVLASLGMTIGGTVNMLLKQIVREKAVPLSLSLNSSNTLYADLLAAETDRAGGYIGRDAHEVVKEMQEIINMVGKEGT